MKDDAEGNSLRPQDRPFQRNVSSQYFENFPNATLSQNSMPSYWMVVNSFY